jgi:toxin ParE1/3/4
MMFRVRIEPTARADIAHHYRYLQKHAFTSDYPDEWFEEITAAILSLAEMPFRCGLAPESEEFEEEIRHLMVGSYRVLFTIEEDRVHVLHVRHGRQDLLRRDS